MDIYGYGYGIYPYGYSEDRLPGRFEFYSSLKGGCISEKGYLHAVKFWNNFKMNTMGDCHDNYVKRDVLLITDVFEKFINTCLKHYGLDSCHYFSSPDLRWDAMLKMSGIELKLISDSNMHYFIEEGMRVGISYIAKIYGKANN